MLKCQLGFVVLHVELDLSIGLTRRFQPVLNFRVVERVVVFQLHIVELCTLAVSEA